MREPMQDGLKTLTPPSHGRIKWIVPGGLLIAIGLFMGYCQTLERPFLDRFDMYEVQDTDLDPATGRYVELGRIYNFSSEGYEVGVFESANPRRDTIDLRKPIFSISSPRPIPQKIEYDGTCYFVRTEFRKDWTNVTGTWMDNETGKSLCFYLLTPSGERINNY